MQNGGAKSTENHCHKWLQKLFTMNKPNKSTLTHTHKKYDKINKRRADSWTRVMAPGFARRKKNSKAEKKAQTNERIMFHSVSQLNDDGKEIQINTANNVLALPCRLPPRHFFSFHLYCKTSAPHQNETDSRVATQQRWVTTKTNKRKRKKEKKESPPTRHKVSVRTHISCPDFASNDDTKRKEWNENKSLLSSVDNGDGKTQPERVAEDDMNHSVVTMVFRAQYATAAANTFPLSENKNVISLLMPGQPERRHSNILLPTYHR